MLNDDNKDRDICMLDDLSKISDIFRQFCVHAKRYYCFIFDCIRQIIY